MGYLIVKEKIIMTNDYVKRHTLIQFFEREYSLRHFMVSENIGKILDDKNQLLAFMSSVKYAEINGAALCKKNEIIVLDLLCDFLAFEEFDTNSIDHSQDEWGTAITQKLAKLLPKNKRPRGDDWFTSCIQCLRDKEDSEAIEALKIAEKFYRLCIKYRVYIAHTFRLNKKKFLLGSDYNVGKILRLMEPEFWRITDTNWQNSLGHALVCQHRMKIYFDIFPTPSTESNEEKHDLENLHALMIDFSMSTKRFSALCERLPAMLTNAYIRQKKANSKKITAADWELHEKYIPFDRMNFTDSAIRNRYIGLYLWDQVNIFEQKLPRIHERLINTHELYGYRQACDKNTENSAHCSDCNDTTNCLNQLRDNLAVTTASVQLNRFVQTSEKDIIGKQNKNKKTLKIS